MMRDVRNAAGKSVLLDALEIGPIIAA